MNKSGSTTLIKDPYVKTVFKTQKELDDFVKCCDPQSGYLYFMDNFFYIQHPTRGSMVYHPYNYQKRLIETYHNYRFSIALMPRQSGKCFGKNTLVTLKNITTGKVEEITIGEFYDRISKVPNLWSRNEGVTQSFVSETSNDSNYVQNYIPLCTYPVSSIVRNKFKKFFRKTKSWVQTQWNYVPLLKKIFKGRYIKDYQYKGRTQQKTKQFSLHQTGLMVKENKWKSRKSSTSFVSETINFFIGKMHCKIRKRRRDAILVSQTTEMVEKFQEAKFFSNFSKIVQPNYGNLQVQSSILCYIFPTRYGNLCQQRIQATINNREDYSTGFYRFRKEENNRVRRNILAWTKDIESKKGKTARTSDNSNWISTFESAGRGLHKTSPKNYNRVLKLSDQVERKFIESYSISEYEVLTDSGFQPVTDLHLTVPYEVYKIETHSGLVLECADTHILFDQHHNQIFAKDLNVGFAIRTVNGIDYIKYIYKTNKKENMFDLTVNHENHRFYSNGILSHNSTSAAGYLLWYAMFVPDSTILIAAHKYTGAQEIMQRIRYAYENCPMHIKAGVTTYNKGSLDFENGSRIVSATTTENTGRGMSISLLYLDEFAFVRPTIAELFWTSITPTLATGGKAIITSTPNSDEDQFALIWKGANKTEDAYGNTTDLGVNGFRAYRAYWHEQPGRDEAWAEQIKAQLGEDRFRREINCFNGSTKISLRDKDGKIFIATMAELENLLNDK